MCWECSLILIQTLSQRYAHVTPRYSVIMCYQVSIFFHISAKLLNSVNRSRIVGNGESKHHKSFNISPLRRYSPQWSSINPLITPQCKIEVYEPCKYTHVRVSCFVQCRLSSDRYFCFLAISDISIMSLTILCAFICEGSSVSCSTCPCNFVNILKSLFCTTSHVLLLYHVFFSYAQIFTINCCSRYINNAYWFV